MPYVYVQKDSKGSVLWECCLNSKGKAPRCGPCMQCKAYLIKNKAKRCKNRTCFGEYCWQHLQKPFYETSASENPSHIGLKIAKSSIPNAGFGVFAARDFEYGEYIMSFMFRKSSLREIRERYDYTNDQGVHQEGIAPYTFKIGGIPDTYGDAACVRNAPSIVNDKKSRSAANVIFKTFINKDASGKTHPTVWLKVKPYKGKKRPRNPIAISAGQELFVEYGKDYWNTINKMKTFGHSLRRVKVSASPEAQHGKRGRIMRRQ